MKIIRRISSVLFALFLLSATVFAEGGAGDGSGSGGGTAGGTKPLTVVSVTCGGSNLSGASVESSGTITINFSNGMADHAEATKSQIKLDGKSCSISYSPDNRKTFLVHYKNLDPGSHSLTIGAGAQANNGLTLGTAYTVKFTVKASETTKAPAETTKVPAETTKAPTAETTKAAARETTKAPTAETTKATARETTKAPAETTKAPAAETTKAAARETTKAPAETTKAPTAETTKATARETTKAPAETTKVPAKETSSVPAIESSKLSEYKSDQATTEDMSQTPENQTSQTPENQTSQTPEHQTDQTPEYQTDQALTVEAGKPSAGDTLIDPAKGSTEQSTGEITFPETNPASVLTLLAILSIAIAAMILLIRKKRK